MAPLAIGVFLLGGCGDTSLNKPLPQAATHLRVTGPWKNGGRIPAVYTCDGTQRVPRIAVARPAGTRAVAIVMTDPDAPGGTFIHWTHWSPDSDGRNSFGRVGYSGPCPPKGDKPHHYVITAYALRKPLALASGSDPKRVVSAIRKSSFASGSFTGRYSR